MTESRLLHSGKHYQKIFLVEFPKTDVVHVPLGSSDLLFTRSIKVIRQMPGLRDETIH